MSQDLDPSTALLTRWLEQYEALIYRVVLSYASDVASQQDLFQEIAVALWRSIHRFQHQAKESTWIYRVAINAAIDFARKGSRTPPTTSYDESEHWVSITPPSDDLAWVYEKIRALAPIDRSLMLMHLDGYPYQEIATVLGITESAVGVKINRVKKQLKALFDKEAHTT